MESRHGLSSPTLVHLRAGLLFHSVLCSNFKRHHWHEILIEPLSKQIIFKRNMSMNRYVKKKNSMSQNYFINIDPSQWEDSYHIRVVRKAFCEIVHGEKHVMFGEFGNRERNDYCWIIVFKSRSLHVQFLSGQSICVASISCWGRLWWFQLVPPFCTVVP